MKPPHGMRVPLQIVRQLLLNLKTIYRMKTASTASPMMIKRLCSVLGRIACCLLFLLLAGRMTEAQAQTPTFGFTSSSFGANESENATVTVRKTGSGAASVDYATSDGTATAPEDFTPTSGTLNFGANETAKTFTVPLINDNIHSGSSSLTIKLRLSNPTCGAELDGFSSSAVVTILDDEDILAARLAPRSLTLKEGGSKTYTVALNHGILQDVTITISGQDGTDLTVDTDPNTNGSQNTLVFTPTTWDDPQTVTINAANDDNDSNERVTLTHRITAGSGNFGTPPQLAVAIEDNTVTASLGGSGGYPSNIREGMTVPIELTMSRALTADDPATLDFTIMLGGDADRGMNMDYTLARGFNGSVPAGITYSNLESGNPTITVTRAQLADASSTELGNVLSIVALKDNTPEESETLTLTLGSNTLDRAIVDNTVTAELSVPQISRGTDYPSNIREGMTVPIQLTMSDSLLANGPATLDFTITLGGDATQGTDYRLARGFNGSVPAGITYSNLESGNPTITVTRAQLADASSPELGNVLSIVTLEDNTTEESESLTLTLGSNTLERAIVDNTVTAELSIPRTSSGGNYASNIPEGVTVPIQLTMSDSLLANGPATLSFTITLGGDATQGTDYRLDPGFNGSDPPGITYSNLDSGTPTITVTRAQLADASSPELGNVLSIVTLDDNITEAGSESLTLTLGDNTLNRAIVDAPASVTFQFSSSDTLSFVEINSPVPGNRGATLVVEIDAVPAQDLNIPLEYSGTATKGVDYVSSRDNLFISAGEDLASQSITISRRRDGAIDEPDETIIVALGDAPAGATKGAQDRGVIIIRDAEPTIVSLERAGNGGINEGDTVEFTVMLNRALVAGDTIDVPLPVGGTNVTTDDWSLALKTGTDDLNTGITLSEETTATPQVRLSGEGAQTATLVLTLARDNITEDAETVEIALERNVNGEDFCSRADLSLRNNLGGGADPDGTNNSFEVEVTNIPPDTVSFTSTAVTAMEGGTADLTVQLSGARTTPTSITIVTLSTSSASENSDYIPGPFPFTIPAGETEGVLSIRLLDDSFDERPETFNVIITDVGLPAGVVLGSRSQTQAAITILDNDPTRVELRGVSDTLVERSTRSMRNTRDFSVRLSGALIAGEVLEVPLTYGGTAVQGTHYTLTHPDPLPMGVTYDSTDLTGGIVTFTGPSAEAVTLTLRAAPGSTRKTVDIGLGTLNADSGTNLDGGASGTDNFEEFTIFTPLTMGIGTLFQGGTLPEGTTTEVLSFSFSRHLNDTDPEMLSFPIMLSGDATQGTDYTLTCGPPIIGATSFGVTCSNLDSSTPVIVVDRTIFGNRRGGALSFNINVIADDADEGNETLTLTPTDGTSVNLTLIDAPASVTVNFTVNTFSAEENSTSLIISFRLDAPTGRDLTIPLMYTDITTTMGVDYTPVSEFVIKANGGTIHELFIPIKATTDLSDPDLMDELDETFTLTMGDAPSGATKGSQNTATVLIRDSNPTEVTLSGTAGNVAEGDTKELTLSLGRGLVDGEGLAVPLTFEGTAMRGTDYTVTCPTSLPQGVTCNDLNTDDAPTVTFTGPATGMTATSVTLTLTATDDEDTESGGEIVNIGLGTLNARSGTNLGGGASGTDMLADFRITDDAVPVTVSSLALSVTEAAGNERTADYTIVLNSTPTADVTIAVTSSDPAAVTVDTNPRMDGAQSMLTFTSTTWNEPQTVTVSAVDDNMDQNTDRTATLRHRAASSDTNYEGTIIDEVAVMVVDDEATPVTLTAAAGDVREGSTKELTLSLGRGLVDGQVLVVPLTFGGTATRGIDYIVDCPLPLPEGVRCGDFTRSSDPAITFTAPETGMTAASVTLTLTAISDNEEESGGETVDIGLGTLNAARGTTLSGGAMGTDNVAAFRISDPPPPPAKPTGFTATAGGKQVTLNWTDPTNNDITGYQFQQKTGSNSFGGWMPISGSGAATTTHTVSGLTNGTAYTFRIRAVAGIVRGTPSEEMTATPVNTDPTVANQIPDQTATVGTAFRYQFSENTFSDADSDALSYTATQGDDSTLPTWLAFDDATRTFSGTPQVADEGTVSVKVTADDGNGGMVSDVFDIVISPAPPPAPPVITIMRGASPVTEGTDATFTVTATPAPMADLTVNLSVAEAGGSSDFVASDDEGTKMVTIPTSGSATYTVATINDDTDEPNGSVTVTVTNGSGYALGSTVSATVMVDDDDDDPAPATLMITIAAGTSPVTEGTDATFTVTATPAPASNLDVNLSVTEAAGSDFVAGANEGSGKTVTIPTSGSATYSVATVADDMDEPNGSVTVTVVADGANYTVGDPASATVMVNDDDEEETLLGIPTSEGISIYPNPASNYFMLTGISDRLSGVSIISTAGKMVRTYPTSEDGVYDTSGLSEGIFFVFIETGSGQQQVGKIVIKRQ